MNINITPPIFLAPFSTEKFKSQYFGRSMLVIHRKAPLHFSKYVSLAHIDELVTSVRIPATNLNLAQGNTPLPLDAYCVGGSYVDKRRVLALHHQGATIILRSVEQWSPELNRLRIAAETFFGFECQINVYITPASEKSTPPHWDTHDLIVMQIAGSKSWRLFEGQRTFPLADERFCVGKDFFSTNYEEVVLHPGDTLYLPRGVIHEPVAETYSVHISIGIHVLRWYDVLNLALQLLAEREGSPLRIAIPAASEPNAPCPAYDVLSSLTEPNTLAMAIDILRQNFEDRRAVDLQGAMLEFAKVSKASVLNATEPEATLNQPE